jgi:hypothetical protein
MIPYCVFFFLIDSLVVWRVITWFHARIRYSEILPIRASAYILSLVNEQVSKGAIALYFLGAALPGQAGPDDGLRPRPTQFFHPLQRGDWPAVSAEGDSRALLANRRQQVGHG